MHVTGGQEGPGQGFQALSSALQYQNLDLLGLLDPRGWVCGAGRGNSRAGGQMPGGSSE